MNPHEERHAFSERLRTSLDRAGWKSIGATTLAREFNARGATQPVTAHAARKWLQGEAIPAQDNLRGLALWLAVPAQWLRFGEGSFFPPAEAPTAPKARESAAAPYGADRAAKLAKDFARLGEEQQAVVEELVGLLLRREQKEQEERKAPPER